MADKDSTKVYLDYLDKEMTIMGILSTFCVAVVGLVLQGIAGANPKTSPGLANIWEQSQISVLVASSLMLLAAFFFYKMRSRVAWLYGQIALSLSTDPSRTLDWLTEADAWTTWLDYQAGFSFMSLAFLYYGASICGAPITRNSWISEHYCLGIILPLLLVTATLIFRAQVFSRYPKEEEPFKKFFSSFRRRS